MHFVFFIPYLINGTVLGKSILKERCVFLFSLQLCLKHFSFWEEFRETLSQMYLHRSSCNVLVALIRFSKNPQTSNLIKIRPVGWEECEQNFREEIFFKNVNLENREGGRKTSVRWIFARYKVVQIWPGLFVCKQVTVCPGHIWTTLYVQESDLFGTAPGLCHRAGFGVAI